MSVQTTIEKLRKNVTTVRYYKSNHVLSVAKTQLAWLERGYCGRCGKYPFVGNRTTCNMCAAKQTKSAIKRRNKRVATGGCERCHRRAIRGKSRCRRCNALAKIAAKKLRELARSEVFTAYGAKCACCGFDDKRFLSLDHVNNDGAEHRQELYGNRQGATIALYRWAKRNNFPKRLQLLCFNCNMGKHRFGGVCPHKLKS